MKDKSYNQGDNGHHVSQEIEAINKLLSGLLLGFGMMRDAMIRLGESLQEFYKALPDAVKRMGKYKQN